MRGNRIKNIVDELAGERIDIVRWSDDPQALIPNALQPAEVDQVLLCDMLGRAIVLVREDQLSLAIGRRGQNVRLASKLCGWDIEIMTAEELDEQIDRASAGFMSLEGMNEELATRLVEQGYLSYDDLSVIEPEALVQMGGLTEEQVERLVEQAEQKAEEAERAAAEERRRQKDQEKLEARCFRCRRSPRGMEPPSRSDGGTFRKVCESAGDGAAEPNPTEEDVVEGRPVRQGRQPTPARKQAERIESRSGAHPLTMSRGLRQMLLCRRVSGTPRDQHRRSRTWFSY